VVFGRYPVGQTDTQTDELITILRSRSCDRSNDYDVIINNELVHTGAPFALPVITGRLDDPRSRVCKMTPVFTGRVDGPCLHIVLAGAREHGPRTRVVCTDP